MKGEMEVGIIIAHWKVWIKARMFNQKMLLTNDRSNILFQFYINLSFEVNDDIFYTFLCLSRYKFLLTNIIVNILFYLLNHNWYEGNNSI